MQFPILICTLSTYTKNKNTKTLPQVSVTQVQGLAQTKSAQSSVGCKGCVLWSPDPRAEGCLLLWAFLKKPHGVPYQKATAREPENDFE